MDTGLVAALTPIWLADVTLGAERSIVGRGATSSHSLRNSNPGAAVLLDELPMTISASLHELCRVLAEEIPDGAARARFLADMQPAHTKLFRPGMMLRGRRNATGLLVCGPRLKARGELLVRWPIRRRCGQRWPVSVFESPDGNFCAIMPAAGQRASHQHWVQTGPHVMIVGPAVREMAGYPRNVDVPDPTQPYAMFPGTPYEHLMLPVAAAK